MVAIKHINKKRIELTRQVLFELKHVGLGMGLGWAHCLGVQGLVVAARGIVISDLKLATYRCVTSSSTT